MMDTLFGGGRGAEPGEGVATRSPLPIEGRMDGEAMSLNGWAKRIHHDALKHGWWPEAQSFEEAAWGIVLAVNRAVAEHRTGFPVLYCNTLRHKPCENCLAEHAGCHNRDRKPEGLAVEMAEALMRILGWFAAAGLDAEQVIRIKHKYAVERR